MDRFEYATAADPARNYCLWDYDPPAPAEDRFRSVNMLYRSFEAAGVSPRAYDVVDAIRDAIGPFQTVFGIKLQGGRLAWEFYFYDYGRRERAVSISRVLRALRPFLACDIPVNENIPYFMFSLDLNDAILSAGRLDVVHMYVGNPHPGNTVSSGIAYGVRAAATTLENFYFFYDARSMLEQVAAKVVSSGVFDASVTPLDTILDPALRRCQTICVANKQTHDCIYFSGIGVDQLLHFLDRLSYPAAITGWVRDSRGELGHLLFDVGYDYRHDRETLNLLKSGTYGIF